MAFAQQVFWRYTFRNRKHPGRVFHACGWSIDNEYQAWEAFKGIVASNPDNEPLTRGTDVLVRSTHEEVEKIKRENDDAMISSGQLTVEELTDGKPNSLISPPIEKDE